MRNDFSLQMTEQQQHLKQLLSQREELITESTRLNETLSIKRENILKIQGVIEYLTQTGVTLPENEESSKEDSKEESEVKENIAVE